MICAGSVPLLVVISIPRGSVWLACELLALPAKRTDYVDNLPRAGPVWRSERRAGGRRRWIKYYPEGVICNLADSIGEGRLRRAVGAIMGGLRPHPKGGGLCG